MIKQYKKQCNEDFVFQCGTLSSCNRSKTNDKKKTVLKHDWETASQFLDK